MKIEEKFKNSTQRRLKSNFQYRVAVAREIHTNKAVAPVAIQIEWCPNPPKPSYLVSTGAKVTQCGASGAL